MSKAEEILRDKFKNNFLDLEYIELYLQAMKEIAELSFDAGMEYYADKVVSDKYGEPISEPNKEQFIQQTFVE